MRWQRRRHRSATSCIEVDEPLLRRAFDRHFYPHAMRPAQARALRRTPCASCCAELDPAEVEIDLRRSVAARTPASAPFPAASASICSTAAPPIFDDWELERVRSFIADHRLEDGALAVRVRRVSASLGRLAARASRHDLGSGDASRHDGAAHRLRRPAPRRRRPTACSSELVDRQPVMWTSPGAHLAAPHMARKRSALPVQLDSFSTRPYNNVARHRRRRRAYARDPPRRRLPPGSSAPSTPPAPRARTRPGRRPPRRPRGAASARRCPTTDRRRCSPSPAHVRTRAQGRAPSRTPQGLPADHQPVSRPLLLLHLPPGSGRAGGLDDAARGGPRLLPPRPRARLHRGADVPRRQAGARLPRVPPDARRARPRRAPSSYVARLLRDRARRRPAAAHQRRRHEPRRDGRAAAAQRQPGPDARDRQPAPARARRRPSAGARQGPGAAPGDDARPPASCRSRSPPASCSASARRCAERVDSLRAIGDLHAAYGHIQEIIIQNFRAKPTHADGGRARARAASTWRAPSPSRA